MLVNPPFELIPHTREFHTTAVNTVLYSSVILCLYQCFIMLKNMERALRSSVMIKGYDEPKRNSSQDNCSEIFIVSVPVMLLVTKDVSVEFCLKSLCCRRHFVPC